MRHDDVIRQGATFYREVEVFSSRLTVEELRAMTPRATLLGTSINMPCAWIGDGTKATLAWTLSRDVAFTLDLSRSYEHILDLYDDTNTHEVLYGTISVRKGPPPV